MGIGDVRSVESVADCYYVDTGMYGTDGYGAVYIYDTERPALVDTGIGTHYDRILDALDEVGIGRSELEYIIPTHAHLDHAGGAGFLVEETAADVYTPEAAAQFLTDPSGLWEGTKRAVGEQIQFYTEPRPVPESRLEPLADGATLDLGDRELVLHDAPGHAFHQGILHEPGDAVVFAADAAGIYVPELDTIRETSPPADFDLEGVVEDAELIADLDPETICYGHFGPAPAADRIETYIAVITDWVESVEAARERLEDDEAVIEHFVEQSTIDEVWGETKGRAEVAMNVRGVLQYLDSE